MAHHQLSYVKERTLLFVFMQCIVGRIYTVKMQSSFVQNDGKKIYHYSKMTLPQLGDIYLSMEAHECV
jgi:hypothetical protein